MYVCEGFAAVFYLEAYSKSDASLVPLYLVFNVLFQRDFQPLQADLFDISFTGTLLPALTLTINDLHPLPVHPHGYID